MNHASHQSDDDLSRELEAAAGGDEAAWRLIVDRYARRVFALARSRVRRPDLAEEITQSVFFTVASKLGTGSAGGYTEQGRFEAWLFRVAVNRIRDEVRRARRHAAATDPEALDQREIESVQRGAAGPAGPSADGASDLDALRRAMGRLSEADREVVELRHHAGMSFAQMAEILDEPLGTLLARHHRALRKLKDMMTRSMPDGAFQ
ncbi:MAG: sigma-70 family RNA polymerase sigma factor [Phycisphaerae bacterium]|nr:sigma-70 family RNA polymerase sigma factor [Phycisphaerae bacterium]